MYKFLANKGQTLAFGVGLFVTVLFLIFVYSGMDEFSTLADDERVNTHIFDFGLFATIGLAVVAAFAMVGFGLYHVASNFKSSVKGVIGVAVLVGVFVAAYAMASGAPETKAIAESADKVGGITSGQHKFIGGSIITALVLVVGASVAFVFSEVRNFFK